SSPMSLFILGEGTLTNDVNTGAVIDGINNTAASFLGVGGRVMDEEGNKVGVAIGGAYNRQLNTEDAGGAVYGEIHGAKEIGGYQFFLDANGHWYNTAPRHNSNFYLNSFVGREFEDGSSGNIAVS